VDDEQLCSVGGRSKSRSRGSQLFPSHLLGRIGLADEWPVDPSFGMEQPKPDAHRRFSIVGRRRHCIAVLLPRCRPPGRSLPARCAGRSRDWRAANGAVLLNAWVHGRRNSARFRLRKVVVTVLTLPCGLIDNASGLQRGFARIALETFTSQDASRGGADGECKRALFRLQNRASECVNSHTYRTLQDSCDEGAPCAFGQGSGTLIGRLYPGPTHLPFKNKNWLLYAHATRSCAETCRLTRNCVKNGFSCTHALRSTVSGRADTRRCCHPGRDRCGGTCGGVGGGRL